MLPSTTQTWQKPTDAQLEILPNLKNMFQPTVPIAPPPTTKQLMTIVASLIKFNEKKKI